MVSQDNMIFNGTLSMKYLAHSLRRINTMILS